MNRVFVDQEKSIKDVVVLYKKIKNKTSKTKTIIIEGI